MNMNDQVYNPYSDARITALSLTLLEVDDPVRRQKRMNFMKSLPDEFVEVLGDMEIFPTYQRETAKKLTQRIKSLPRQRFRHFCSAAEGRRNLSNGWALLRGGQEVIYKGAL